MRKSVMVMMVALGAVAALAAVACGGPNPLDPENEIPVGFVDSPPQGAILAPGRTVVGGWAVDDRGIAEIRIYFDGRYRASTTIKVARPDVAKAMAKYARGTDMHGWNTEVDFGLESGAHFVLVQAVDTNGVTRDIGTVTVTIPK